MGCFLGCFGGAKDHKRRKHRVNRASPQRQRNRVQNIQQENVISAEQLVTETTHTNLDPELRNKPKEVEQLSPGPKKRVTFNSNITTYEHVSVHESIDSLPEYTTNEKEEQEYLKTSSYSHSISEDDHSITSSVGSYPPNHRYHNARKSDDEAEEYGDSDLDDDLDDEVENWYSDEDIDARISSQEVWCESVLTASMESRTEITSAQATSQELESPMVKDQPPDKEVKAVGSKTNARDRSDYINSVLNPVENITQWRAAKSKGTNLLKPQKENFADFEEPRISFSSEATFGPAPISLKTKNHQFKNINQEIAVDASLSNWLVSSEITPSKKTSPSCFETITKSGQTTPSERCTSVRSFEDRPILGALTIEELRQISASPSPRKSPNRSPDEMPIIGTVGTYWNHSDSIKHSDSASSFKGMPNTTSKYIEVGPMK